MRGSIFAFLGATVLSVGTAQIANAADMPVKARPLMDPLYNWTGFYIGANGGYGWGSSNNNVGYSNNFGAIASSIGPGSAKGGFGGAQIGYNWQIRRFVIGLEADFEGSGIRNSTASQIIDAGGDILTTSQKLSRFYTVRGRAGYTFGRTLAYFTGGFAGGRVENQAVISNTGLSATLVDGTSRSGYVVGGGLEYAFAGPWSAKIEYQYIDLGSQILSGAVVPPNGTTVTSTSINDRFSTVRIGLNYRFGGGY